LQSSNGLSIEAPLFFKQNRKAIEKANRELSRKKKGSANRGRARMALARLHKKTANQRADFHFKLARNLSGEYATICIEDLNMKAMQKLWGRKISDLGFSEFVNVLEYQCSKTGSTVVKISRFYPSSKTCSACGHVLDELKVKNMVKNHKLAKAISEVSWGIFRRLIEYKAKWYGRQAIIAPSNYASSQLCSACGNKSSQTKDLSCRTYICPECSLEIDRDYNASLNLLKLVM
jgi:IS605 OrfB family transposase